MTDDVIAKSTAEATIRAPLAAIDLTKWIFTLTDSEYQACSKNHIAAAVTVTPDLDLAAAGFSGVRQGRRFL